MINFSKPPDKNIDWTIWSPLIPHNIKKYLTCIILGVTTVFSIILVFTLRQNTYHTTIYDILYNVIIYNIFSKSTVITSQIFVYVLVIFITLTYVLILIGLHEFVHIICYPDFWRKHIYIFLDKRTMALCLFYDGETSRERRILINVMPIIILSCGMILVSFIFDGNLHYMLQITAFINLATSSADIVGVFLLLKLPTKAVLYNGIWRQT